MKTFIFVLLVCSLTACSKPQQKPTVDDYEATSSNPLAPSADKSTDQSLVEPTPRPTPIHKFYRPMGS